MKYDPLKAHLCQIEKNRIHLTFSQIEDILSFSLPYSAKNHRAWWANGSHDHAAAWLDAGYRVGEVNFNRQYVVFVRDVSTKSIRAKTSDSKNLKQGAQKAHISCRSTDDTMTVCGYTFTFIQELIPECDADGYIKEYQPQAGYIKEKSLNTHGSGSFCRFTIHAGNWPGVYLWVVDSEIIYIGETAALARRFNTGYGVIEPVNCFVGGQSTNCKMNKVVLEQAKKGRYVKLYFYGTDNYKKVELELLGIIKTKYNVKDN